MSGGHEAGHRFMGQLTKAFDLGEPLCCLHGENVVNEWFDNGILHGVRDLRETLAVQLLFELEKVQKVLLLSKNEMVLFSGGEGIELQKRLLANVADVEEALQGEADSIKVEGVLGEAALVDEEDTSSENGDDASAALSDPALRLLPVFERISAWLAMPALEPFAVVVEGFHWIANLFPQQQPHLPFLEEVEGWARNGFVSKHLAILCLPSLEPLLNYLPIREDKPQAVYIGGPSVVELERSLESLPRATKKRAVDLSATHRKVAASVLKNQGLSLLNAAHLVCRLSDDLNREEGNPQEVFVSRLKQRLGDNIEEVAWETDLHLPGPLKSKIKATFDRFLRKEEENSPKGILLHGPPGTGKTHAAKALSQLGGCFFMPLKLADLKGRFVGESGQNVRRIFQDARASAPTLIFIDEIDSVFSRRGSDKQDSFAADIVNQFLAESDGVDTSAQQVFIVGATNRLDMVDEAIKSRLEPIEVPLPDADFRPEILCSLLAPLLAEDLVSELELTDLVKQTEGLSGRDLKTLAGDITRLQGAQDPSPVASALQNLRNAIAGSLCSDSFNLRLPPSSADSESLPPMVGFAQEKERLSQLVSSLKSLPDSLLRARLQPSNGVLLYGPPGNGKTLLVAHLAEEHALPLVLVEGRNLAAGFADGTVRLLDEIFENSLRMAAFGSLLLFFDEFDALAGRGIDPKIRAAFLTGISRLRKRNRIVILAATNFPEQLDEAIIRPGRFDLRVFCPNPAAETIRQQIEMFVADRPFTLLLSASDLKKLAKSLAALGVSYSAVDVLCHDVCCRALQMEPPREKLVLSDFEAGITLLSERREG